MPYASPSIESFFGMTHEAVADDFSPVFARIHPEDVGHVNVSIAESATSMQPWRDSFRYNHPTKGEIWIEGSSMPEREDDGSILWHGYIQDVTERKLAEIVLESKERELRLIINATPALISYLDTDFRYLRVNKAYENWFCLHQEQILGHAAQEILGEKAWGIVSPNLERARSGERISFDYQIPYGTGKPRWVHGNYIPDKDANGNVKGVVVHVTDIDDRKKAELALEESERQNRFLADILDQADQPFGVGYPDGRMKYVNHAFELLTGFSRDELLAMDWAMELTPPEWKALEQAKLEELQHNQRAICNGQQKPDTFLGNLAVKLPFKFQRRFIA
jgi:PAS domain S-box-containing protein